MINSKVTDIKNIRKDKIIYMIAWTFFYAWLVSFFTWWINSFSKGILFERNTAVLINILILLFVTVFSFFIKPQKFKKYITHAGILGILILIFYGFCLTIKSITLYKDIIILLSISIAFVFLGLLSSFIYILNNTEKFYSCITGNITITTIAIIQNAFRFNVIVNYLILSIVFIITILMSLKFKEQDYEKEEAKFSKTAPEMTTILYVSIFINCIFLIFCRGVGRALLLIANEYYPEDLEIFYYLGGLIGCIILYLIYKFHKKSNSITWNIIFGTFIFAMFLYAVSNEEFVIILYSLILGIGATMGISSMYYILGVISKKYWNYSYVKYNILWVAILGCGLGSLFGNIIYKINDPNFIKIVIIISVLLTLILLVISPVLVVTFYNYKWDEDATKATIDNLNLRKFLKYNLTNKEIEVCNYLLKNLTVRQIAITMDISENTVKFHKKQIFEKLNISSKDEIFSKIK